MPNFNIKESFNWMTPEFKTVDAGKNTIKIKGVALKSDVVSRNKRKYCDEELVKSARTFVGKPVTINHDMNRIVGNVVWMEYENGALEYIADIKKQPYVRLLRDHSTEIKGVSIEANYLHNRCSKCGAQFYTEQDFHAHMSNEHFIKTDPTSEPHGIIGQALSLVLSPEEPGYTDTSIELMETYRKPVLQLLETVTKIEKEKKDYMKKLEGKAVLTKESRQVYNKQLKEQSPQDNVEAPAHPTEEPEGGCPEGEHKDEEGNCVADDIEADKVAEQDFSQGTCPAGFHDDGAGGCEADPIPEEAPPTNAPTVNEPEIKIPKVDVPTPAPTIPSPLTEQSEQDNVQPPVHPVEAGGKECLPGSHYDEIEGSCVPDLIPEEKPSTEPPAVKAVEIHLPKLLTLGEPTDEHGCEPGETWDGEKCVKQEPVSETMNIYESVKRLDRRTLIRDREIAKTVNKENRALAEVVKTLTVLPRQLAKPVGVEAKLRAKADKQNTQFIKENVLYIKALTDKALKKQSAQIDQSNKSIVEQVNKALSGLSSTINKASRFTNTKVNQLATANAKLARKVASQKRDYEKILHVVEQKVNEKDTKIKTLEQRIKEQEEECPEGQHRNDEGKCVDNAPPPETEETKKLKETVSKLETTVENLVAKQKGDFRGISKPVNEQAETRVRDTDRTGVKKPR